jgi:hypothetical protein
MDVRVINVEEESDHQATDDGDAERSDGEINNAESFGFNVEEGSSSETQNLHPRKHFSSVGRTMPETYQGVGLVPSGVMYGSTDGNHVSNQNTCAVLNIHASTAADPSLPVKNATSMNYTARPPSQNRTLGKDAHHLLEYFKKMQGENPGFFYAIQLDEDNHMSNVFWADARSMTAYSHFGDAVHLDTTCRVNQYSVPFAPFTGVTVTVSWFCLVVHSFLTTLRLLFCGSLRHFSQQ